MKGVSKTKSFFERVNSTLANLDAAIIMILALLISVDVTMRYLFSKPIPNVLETTEHALVYITFLGAAWVLRRGGHIRVDVLYNQLSPRTQALLNVINSLLGAIVCLALTWSSAQAAFFAYQGGHVFPTSWSFPRAPILGIIPVGGFLLFIEFIIQSYANLGRWRLQRNSGTKVAETASN